eukprot:30033-Rhodomonas_salina.4
MGRRWQALPAVSVHNEERPRFEQNLPTETQTQAPRMSVQLVPNQWFIAIGFWGIRVGKQLRYHDVTMGDQTQISRRPVATYPLFVASAASRY